MGKYCCKSFENNLNLTEENNRGFSLEFTDDYYKIKFKVVESIHEEEFFKVLPNCNTLKDKGFKNLSLGGELGISFCPWCGTELSAL